MANSDVEKNRAGQRYEGVTISIGVREDSSDKVAFEERPEGN